MKDFYYNQLSLEVRDLVNEIEDFCKVEINIEIDENRTNALATEVTEMYANILIPKEDFFPEPSVFHELLHIKRFYVDKVPKIILCIDPGGYALEDEVNFITLDNSIEHLSIVPEELHKYPERAEYWEEIAERQIEVTLDKKRLGDACINWIFICHVLNNAVLKDKAKIALERLKIIKDANKFYEDVVANLGSKEKLTISHLNHFGLTLNGICFEYIDIINHELKGSEPFKSEYI